MFVVLRKNVLGVTDDICRICGGSLNDGRATVQVKLEKAVKNINECAHLRGLCWAGTVKAGDQFHVDCRKPFV